MQRLKQKIRIRKPATICFSSLFCTFIIYKTTLLTFFLAYRCILKHFINVYAAVGEVQMKRAEDMKPQKVASDSEEPMPWAAPRRSVSVGCRIPLQAMQGPRRVQNKHQTRGRKCSGNKWDKAKSYGQVPRKVSPPNIPFQIYYVATLSEIRNGKALFPPHCLQVRLTWAISSYRWNLGQEKIFHMAAGRVITGLK